MSAAESTLTEALEAQAATSKKKIPEEAKAVMAAATAELAESGITKQVIKEGAVLPDAKLLSPHGKETSLYNSIGDGKAIITFYRGGWCPYCNIQLHHYQKALPEFQKRNAQLVAITPESPDNSLSTTEKNELKFQVLSDKDNTYARSLGLVFGLNKDLKEVYESFGINLAAANESENWELPLAATFVVDEQKKVVYRYVTEDYTKRASVEELMEALGTPSS